MEYNPFTQEYNRLSTIINELNNKKNQLADELNWFDSTNISDLNYQLDSQMASAKNYESIKANVRDEIIALNDHIKTIKQNIKSLLNPFNWFDNKQILLRTQLEESELNLRNIEKHEQDNLVNLLQTEDAINTHKIEIDKFEKFNKNIICAEIDRFNGEIALSQFELESITESKLNVDNALESILKQINNLESEISKAKYNISYAESFDRKLNNATNSYQRAMTHQECERVLGAGNPRKIIGQQGSIVRQLQSDLEKAVKRATQIGITASRAIKKIVIDGNNMCYEGSKFVGLQPLLITTIELEKHYDVIVVFDPTIRSLLQANDSLIKSQFNNDIKVHIVTSKRQADESILDIASNDDLCYVLSNAGSNMKCNA